MLVNSEKNIYWDTSSFLVFRRNYVFIIISKASISLHRAIEELNFGRYLALSDRKSISYRGFLSAFSYWWKNLKVFNKSFNSGLSLFVRLLIHFRIGIILSLVNLTMKKWFKLTDGWFEVVAEIFSGRF